MKVEAFEDGLWETNTPEILYCSNKHLHSVELANPRTRVRRQKQTGGCPKGLPPLLLGTY